MTMKQCLCLAVLCVVTVNAAIRSIQLATDRWCPEIITFIVQLAPTQDPFEYGERNKIMYIDQVGELEMMFEYKVACSNATSTEEYNRDVDAQEAAWFERHSVQPGVEEYIEFQRKVAMKPKTIPWHLSGDNAINSLPSHVQQAWNLGFNGADVIIGVVDNGFHFDHADIRPGFSTRYSYNYNSGDPDAFWDAPGDTHGTACLSIAAAAGRGTSQQCAVGVAKGATSAGIRAIAEDISPANLARALSHNIRLTGVMSCSFGLEDDGNSIGGPGTAEMLAIDASQTIGRRGFGTNYYWACGNGGSIGDRCDFDGFIQQANVNGIGAIDDNGDLSYFSEKCAALMFVAPSSGGTRGITAATPLGMSMCTSSFGGTSASAPFEAGVDAVIQSANPHLNSRDVTDIQVLSCIKPHPSHGSWITNHVGTRWSEEYGFGLVDLNLAVRLALNSTPGRLGQQIRSKVAANTCLVVSTELGGITQETHIPASRPCPCAIRDTPNAGTTVQYFVNKRNGRNLVVEFVQVSFSIKHARRSQLVFRVVSPSGTVIDIPSRAVDIHADYNWMFKWVGFRGENATGRWLFSVTDVVSGVSGILTSSSFAFYGH